MTMLTEAQMTQWKQHRREHYSFKEHPVCKQPYPTRLYFISLLAVTLKSAFPGKEAPLLDEMLTPYRAALVIRPEDEALLAGSGLPGAESGYAVAMGELRKREGKLTKLSIYKNYSHYGLLAEVIRLTSKQDRGQAALVSQLAEFLRIPPSDTANISVFLKQLERGQHRLAQELLQGSKTMSQLQHYMQMAAFDSSYAENDGTRVVIAATMSSGKSTFLNGLLAQDLLPAKNEACTSKVIEIVHHPQLDAFIGYAAGSGKPAQWSMAELLTKQQLNEWNDSEHWQRIRLEGAIPGLPDRMVTFIDTPGTNNHVNRQHQAVTLELLSSGQYELVCYLLNAASLGVDDDLNLLRQVAALAKGKPLLFILNKMDEIDPDGNESFRGLVRNADTYLRSAGIESPNIVPLSGYAAKLFYKQLNQEAFTSKEKFDYQIMRGLFSDKRYDLTKYAHFTDPRLRAAYLSKQGRSSAKQGLDIALNRTGIISLRQMIGSMISAL